MGGIPTTHGGGSPGSEHNGGMRGLRPRPSSAATRAYDNRGYVEDDHAWPAFGSAARRAVAPINFTPDKVKMKTRPSSAPHAPLDPEERKLAVGPAADALHQQMEHKLPLARSHPRPQSASAAAAATATATASSTGFVKPKLFAWGYVPPSGVLPDSEGMSVGARQVPEGTEVLAATGAPPTGRQIPTGKPVWRPASASGRIIPRAPAKEEGPVGPVPVSSFAPAAEVNPTPAAGSRSKSPGRIWKGPVARGIGLAGPPSIPSPGARVSYSYPEELPGDMVRSKKRRAGKKAQKSEGAAAFGRAAPSKGKRSAAGSRPGSAASSSSARRKRAEGGGGGGGGGDDDDDVDDDDLGVDEVDDDDENLEEQWDKAIAGFRALSQAKGRYVKGSDVRAAAAAKGYGGGAAQPRSRSTAAAGAGVKRPTSAPSPNKLRHKDTLEHWSPDKVGVGMEAVRERLRQSGSGTSERHGRAPVPIKNGDWPWMSKQEAEFAAGVPLGAPAAQVHTASVGWMPKDADDASSKSAIRPPGRQGPLASAPPAATPAEAPPSKRPPGVTEIDIKPRPRPQSAQVSFRSPRVEDMYRYEVETPREEDLSWDEAKNLWRSVRDELSSSPTRTSPARAARPASPDRRWAEAEALSQALLQDMFISRPLFASRPTASGPSPRDPFYEETPRGREPARPASLLEREKLFVEDWELAETPRNEDLGAERFW